MSFKQIFESISSMEWKVLTGLVFLAIVLTTAPVVYGWLMTPVGYEFTGVKFFLPEDWFVYISHIEQISQGGVLLENLFTHERQAPVFNWFWLVVGLVGRWFGLNPLLTFELSRILLLAVFGFWLYIFLAFIFKTAVRRITAFLLSYFASGLGFLLLYRLAVYPNNIVGTEIHWPLDIWSLEGSIFASLIYSPHVIMSNLLLMMTFFCFLLFIVSGHFKYAIISSILACLQVLFHPFHAVTLGLVLAIFVLAGLVRRKEFSWRLLLGGLIAESGLFVAALYYFLLLKTDQTMMIKSWQNICPSPGLMLLAIGLGLPLALAALGSIVYWRSSRNDNSIIIFIIIWGVVGVSLAYFPVNFQRRLIQGASLPLAILAVFGLEYLYNFLVKYKIKNIIFYWPAAILFFGSTLVNIGSLVAVYQEKSEVAYVLSDTIDAARQLKDIPKDSIVFGSPQYDFVNIVPAYSGRKVYAGHAVETLWFDLKKNEIIWFFQKNRDPNIELAFLDKRQISHLWYSDLEKDLGEYQPIDKNYLNKIYENPKVVIYEVVKR